MLKGDYMRSGSQGRSLTDFALSAAIIFAIFFLLRPLDEEKYTINTATAGPTISMSSNGKDIQKSLEEIKALISQQITTSKVEVTFYHPASGGINSDEHPNKTCIMEEPIAGWTIAISTELVELGWLGHKIYIDGYGVFEATDRMAPKLKGKRIDICVGSKEEALQGGRKKNVLAVKLLGDF